MKKIVVAVIMMISSGFIAANAQTSQTAKSNVQFSIADSSSFTGKYKYADLPFEYMDISVKEDKLYFAGGEYNGFLDPVPDKKDVFDVGGEATFTFRRDKENKIVALQIDYQGKTYLGNKEEKK